MKKTAAAVWAAAVWTGAAALGQVALPGPWVRIEREAGEPMQVKRLEARAEVRGAYARVETTLEFFNPNGRDLEGELEFPLPDGGAVCGYALDIGGVLTDGVVVTKEKARVTFETEARRRVDPGVVEHVQGNLYKTRIYPLPANGRRTVKVAYTAPLAADEHGDLALLLPMPREKLEKRRVDIEVVNEGAPAPRLGGLGDARFEQAENVWRVSSEETDVAPGDDVLVAMPAAAGQTQALERGKDGKTWFALTAVAPAATADESRPAPEFYTVWWDASGSRAGAHEKEYAMLRALPASPKFALKLVRNTVADGGAFADADALVAALEGVAYDGGTSLKDVGGGEGVNLVFTDGLDTLTGEAAGPWDAVAVVAAATADREGLRQACGGRLVDLTVTGAEAAADAAAFEPLRVRAVKGKGLADVQGLGAVVGGRARILGRLTGESAKVTVEFSDGSAAVFDLDASKAREGETLGTAWAAMRVQQLGARADDCADELLALGRRYGVVSPTTSLIVLESLDQWVRHEIEPPDSLPDLQAAWRDRMKSRGHNEGLDRERHLEKLAKLWKERKEWWKNPGKWYKPPAGPHPVPRGGEPVDGLPAPEAAAAESPRGLRRLFSRSERMAAPMASVARDEMVAYEMADNAPPDFDGVVGGVPAEAENSDVFGGAVETIAAPTAAERKGGAGRGGAATVVEIKEWDPAVPYLKELKKAKSAKTREKAYLKARAEWAKSPAFFLDCADCLLKAGETELGRRVLSNLAEMKLEDAGMLRILAWRLRQAGDLDAAVVALRRVLKLRPEEPQVYRDLALVLIERGKARKDKADLEEAMALLQKTAFTPWNRHADSIPLFALEEMNELAAWCKRQTWEDGAPEWEAIPKKFAKNLDMDLRIVMSWDADNTDMDLHVTEPGGEEAFYGHRFTAIGGMVSRDITDGYGPEEYLLRRAKGGKYTIFAHYFASHQQTVTGPATVTATVYTQWGREGQTERTMTLRLDKSGDKHDIGSITVEDGTAAAVADSEGLHEGMTREEADAFFGGPGTAAEDGRVAYEANGKRYVLVFGEDGLESATEQLLPDGPVTVLFQ